MNEQELKQYNMAQIEEIKRYKWLESKKAGYDIGTQRAALEWISKHSQQFRNTFSCKQIHS